MAGRWAPEADRWPQRRRLDRALGLDPQRGRSGWEAPEGCSGREVHPKAGHRLRLPPPLPPAAAPRPCPRRGSGTLRRPPPVRRASRAASCHLGPRLRCTAVRAGLAATGPASSPAPRGPGPGRTRGAGRGRRRPGRAGTAGRRTPASAPDAAAATEAAAASSEGPGSKATFGGTPAPRGATAAAARGTESPWPGRPGWPRGGPGPSGGEMPGRVPEEGSAGVGNIAPRRRGGEASVPGPRSSGRPS